MGVNDSRGSAATHARGKRADGARAAAPRKPPAAASPRDVQARAARRRGLASRAVFYQRLRRSGAFALGLVAVTLLVGTIGYVTLAHLAWIDAFHQSALIMSGMGPLDESGWSDAAKLFDSVYALFCGMLLLLSTGILFAPVLHRIVHRFHLQDAPDD
jgi:hypothetical protein